MWISSSVFVVVRHSGAAKSPLILSQIFTGEGTLVVGDRRQTGLPGSDNRNRSDTGRVEHG